ncbi:MAG: zf-HC2 domain-containing protein [Methylotenera sp.]|nr:zf-HC2 domain-containing protein [Methylotenera sp.]
MMNCKEANQLMSQELDRKLTWRELAALKFHVTLCDGCANARKQVSFIHHACKHAFGLEDEKK